ncbi:hypothetical protein ACH4FX_12555 [Streptomyces sp. NPDC018019]|uniref:hypothetical protein n=1 Tax=Streptomyces sp. NPDC018019 TaxID=3365030 RepID=UPI0037BDEC34
MNILAWVVACAGTVGTVAAAAFTARAATRAAAATARANEAAARAAAEPAHRTAGLAVLQATVDRVDQENAALRTRMSRTEALVRAYSWTVDALYRWARDPVGDPPEPHRLVKEYNDTGS